MFNNAVNVAIKQEIEDVKLLTHFKPQQTYGIMRDPPTLNFDPEKKMAFLIWKRKWESWLYMATSEGQIEPNQIYHWLINCFSEQTVEYYLNLGLSEVDEKNPEKIIQSLSGLTSMTTNRNVHRHKFQERVQKPGEKFDAWLAALKDLMKRAEFDQDCCGKCKNARLLQQIISGVVKPETRKMLFDIGPGLTLEQAGRVIDTAGQTESDLADIVSDPAQMYPALIDKSVLTNTTLNNTVTSEVSLTTEVAETVREMEEEPFHSSTHLDRGQKRATELVPFTINISGDAKKAKHDNKKMSSKLIVVPQSLNEIKAANKFQIVGTSSGFDRQTSTAVNNSSLDMPCIFSCKSCNRNFTMLISLNKHQCSATTAKTFKIENLPKSNLQNQRNIRTDPPKSTSFNVANLQKLNPRNSQIIRMDPMKMKPTNGLNNQKVKPTNQQKIRVDGNKWKSANMANANQTEKPKVANQKSEKKTLTAMISVCSHCDEHVPSNSLDKFRRCIKCQGKFKFY